MKFHKDKKHTEFQVGLFTIVTLVILVLGYSWLTEVLESRKYTKLEVSFPNAANVEIGSTVTINGVKKGRVESIQVNPDGVVLILYVELDFILMQGTRFYILESNLMGEVQVEIIPGNLEKELDTSSLQVGERHYGMTKLIAELSEIVYGLKDIMSTVSGDDNIMNDFQAIVDTSKVVINKFNNVLNMNESKISELLENSSKASKQLTNFIETNEDKVTETFALSKQAIEEFNSALVEIRSMSTSVQNLSDKVMNEDNSINRLITEKTLYENLINATESMDSLLIDIKKNPKRYFKIKVF
jgi:phospholipid/cholesterol/gamma-HCH transport system substrate-binding protein